MRIVLILPCCIGDVIMATPVLAGLRRAYPTASITWAVGGWSGRAVQTHPALDAILDTGDLALPVKSWRGFGHFVRQLRQGQFDMAVSLVRSPLMSLAVRLSGIAKTVGLDSNGRGFGYHVRAKIDPAVARHECDIFLDVLRVLGHDVSGLWANLPVLPEAQTSIQAKLTQAGIQSPYIVIHAGGGSNPGMVMSSKRWLPENFGQVADDLAQTYHAQIILIGAKEDTPILDRVQATMKHSAITFAGELSFPEIGALAQSALLYLGNDTGLTHLASAGGAKTAMILGPSDPVRYAPFTPNSIALWKPTTLRAGGVAQAETLTWDWARDGISVAEALTQLHAFLQR